METVSVTTSGEEATGNLGTVQIAGVLLDKAGALCGLRCPVSFLVHPQRISDKCYVNHTLNVPTWNNLEHTLAWILPPSSRPFIGDASSKARIPVPLDYFNTLETCTRLNPSAV